MDQILIISALMKTGPNFEYTAMIPIGYIMDKESFLQ